MKIKKDDLVLMTAGKDKKRKGKVLAIFPKEDEIIVEGLNIIKKTIKPKKEGEKGKIVEIPRPVDISNVKLICPVCKKPTKVAFKIKKENGKKRKSRVCKKCDAEII